MTGSRTDRTTLDIGVAHLGDSAPSVIIDRTRRLERCEGVTRAWIADERFLHDPWVLLGSCAVTTERLSLGPCVTDPFIRHPALTANAMATLDDLSGGRALLSLGAGATGFAALGMKHADPATALRDAVELSRQLWQSHGPVHFVRTGTQFIDDQLHSAPHRRIPIYIAGRGERVLRVAAEVADSVLIGNLLAGPGLDYALATISSGAAKRHPDLPPLRLAAWVYLSVDDDADAAREAVKAGVVMAVRTSQRALTRAGVNVPVQLTDAINSLPEGRLATSDISRLVRQVPDRTRRRACHLRDGRRLHRSNS